MRAAENTTDALIDADLRFHHAMLVATHNELVEQMSVVIEIGLRTRDRHVHGHGGPVRASVSDHDAVWEAVRNRDPERARSAMTDLLVHAAEDARIALRVRRSKDR
jgi:GntR family transcriptional regulator, galactonate operon transcriptional repressor